MATRFDSLETALRVRDLIRKQAQTTFKQSTPNESVGRMISVDLSRRRGTCWFPGDDQPVEVHLLPSAIPAEWHLKKVSTTEDSTSTSGYGSEVVCRKYNGVLYVVDVLSGGTSAVDLNAWNMSIIPNKATAVGSENDAVVDVADDPHETFINCRVADSTIVEEQGIEFGPFTSFDAGIPPMGWVEITVKTQQAIKLFRFPLNTAAETETDYSDFAGNPGNQSINANLNIYYRLLPEQSINDDSIENAIAPRDDFWFDVAYRQTSYGNTEEFGDWKEVWFRIVKSNSQVGGLDAKITIRSTNLQRGRALGGRQLFMQRKLYKPSEAVGYIGFHQAGHIWSGLFGKSYDSFGRIRSVGFGTTETEDSWVSSFSGTGSSSADFSTDGVKAIVKHQTTGNQYEALITNAATQHNSIDAYLLLGLSAMPTGAAVQHVFIFCRNSTTNERYYAICEIGTTGAISVRLQKFFSGVISDVGSTVATGYTWGPGGRIWLRVTFNQNKNEIALKAWNHGTREPFAYQKTSVDTSMTTGHWGYRAFTTAGNTNPKPYETYLWNIKVNYKYKVPYQLTSGQTWHTGPWRSGPVRLAQDLQKTWCASGPITWDGTYLKWASPLALSSVGAHMMGLSNGGAYIEMPYTDATFSVPIQPDADGGGPSDLFRDGVTNLGIPLNAQESLWCAVPPGVGFENLWHHCFIVKDQVLKDYQLPEWAVLIAARSSPIAVPEIRLGNGMSIDKWRPLSFQNSWTNYGSGYAAGAYRMDDGFTVRLKGLVKSGTSSTIANLPSGFRPLERLMFSSINTDAWGRVDITPTGDIVRATATGNGFIQLDGITFAAEQ